MMVKTSSSASPSVDEAVLALFLADKDREKETGKKRFRLLSKVAGLVGISLDAGWKNIRGVLDRWGVEPIPGEGVSFDPAIHRAISSVETLDQDLHLVIAQVTRPGYVVHGQVQRQADVVVYRVAQNPTQTS